MDSDQKNKKNSDSYSESPTQSHNSADKWMTIAVVALTLAALGLGYLLYSKKVDNPMSMREEVHDESEQMPEEQSFNFPTPTDDELAVLDTPEPGSSEQDFIAHLDLVRRTAVATGELAVGPECVVYPVTLSTRLGSEITMRNYDNVPHGITLNEDNAFHIPARGSITVTANFGQGAGVYGYGCDLGTEAAGMILVGE